MLTALLSLAASARGGEDLLRYSLRAGDRVTFEGRTRAAGQAERAERVTFWCIDRREETFSLLAVHEPGGAAADGVRLDLGALGQWRLLPPFAERFETADTLRLLLPALPTSFVGKGEWTSEPDADGRRWRCVNRGADERLAGAERIDFVLEASGGAVTLDEQVARGTFWFSAAQHLPVRIEARVQRRGVTTLDAVFVVREAAAVDGDWLRRRRDEFPRYEDALRLANRWRDEVVNSGRPADALARLGRLWSGLQSEWQPLKDSPFPALVTARAAELAADTPRLQARASAASGWVGRVAAHWSLTSPAGESVLSESYLGRPLVEYYWSAETFESLRGLAAVRALRESDVGRGIGVVCVNLDADLRRAQRAIALCGDGLEHVLAGPPLSGTEPGDLPIARLLGPDRTVREAWFGRRADYAGLVRRALQGGAP